MLKPVRYWSLVLLVCLAAAPAAAQSRATAADLTGSVIDSTRSVLPGATVTVTHLATNAVRTAITGTEGRFVVPALPPGAYRVRVELAGFATQFRDVTLALGATVDIDVVLGLAGTEETVTVTGQASPVDVQQTAVSSVVSQQQIEALPTNGRNFIAFSIITPAVNLDRTPQQGASATSGLSFAGQRARSNNITVDGLDNNDSALGSVRATFSQEAVREFQVLTNSYSAEFGKASGGVVNIVTKSGTNDFDGNVFGYLRNDTLNAKEYFEKFDSAGQAVSRPKAPYDQYQYGATAGGPVVRDRAFFFLSFERLDIRANNFVTIDDTTPITVFGRAVGTTRQILERAGFPIETGNVPYRVTGNQFLAKVDHQLRPTQMLAFRFNTATAYNENVEPWGGQVARSRGALLDSRDDMAAASHLWVLSGDAVNELRAQYAYRNQKVLSLDPRCGGPCTAEDQGGPTIEVPGVAFAGRHRFTPQPRKADRVQVLDTLSYYTGRHNFKGGLDYSWVNNTASALPLHFGGRYVFSAFPASLAALLGLPGAITAIQAVALGLPAAYVQGYGNASVPYKVSDVSLFVQDDWRPVDTVTLKLGVRYQNQFWPDTQYDVGGVGKYTFPTDNNNVAPRLAVSWDPTGDKRTAIHGSYGIFFDNHIQAVNGITAGINGTTGVRTLAAQLPSPLPIVAWNAPGRRLPAAAVGTAFPSLVISIDPGLKTPYAYHASAGIDRELAADIAVAANFIYARGKDQLGTIDYNPVVPSLGAGRRPNDVNGIAGTSSSVLQYTTFGETWYRGLTLSATKRLSRRTQFMASYTISKAEDNSTDYQSAFVPAEMGRGRDPNDPKGLPIGFDPISEKGPSLQDQRHRFVLSGLVLAPGDVQISSIVTLGSGRPYNILAGVDLNGDGNGGATAPDRPRTNPSDPSTAIVRNAGLLPNQYTVDVRVARRFGLGGSGTSLDAMLEVFNLFDHANITDVNPVFGTAAYPASPLPTFGQYTQAAPPRQMQLALKFNF